MIERNCDFRPAFRVENPGILSTIQDKGRFGKQMFGISPCGAMDRLALRVGNRLVGNPEYLPALELATPSPVLEVLAESQVAITGGELSPNLNGEPLPSWESHNVLPGQRISFGKRMRGSRAYLCVEGGVQGDLVLGSCSTDLRARIGGLGGRSLRFGDVLKRGPTSLELRKRGKCVASLEVLQEYREPFVLRVVEGPQVDHFQEAAIHQFYRSQFLVTSKSSRMGHCLDGPLITPSKCEIISDPVTTGGIQALPDGRLVLLMTDHPTVGGYPKIAAVISADLHKAAQLRSGHQVQFRKVNLETAHQLLKRLEQLIACSVTATHAVLEPVAARKGDL